MSLFQNILTSVMKGTRRLNRFGSKSFGKLHNNINKAVDSVMSTSGEVSSLGLCRASFKPNRKFR